MRFLAAIVPLALVLLSSVPSARQTTSSPSPPKLVRRHQHADHAPYVDVYLMEDNVDFSNGPLKIFNPDGTLAFKYDQATRDPRKRFSYASLYNTSDQKLLNFTSEDDACYFKSHFEEPVVAGSANRQVTIDPRGPKPDRWTFSLVSPSDEKLTYVFKRNFWNKGGKIYLSRGEKESFVAKLQDQVRWEAWLNPGATGTSTYTLSLTKDAPQLEFVLLMGMVLVRTYRCGRNPSPKLIQKRELGDSQT